MNKGNLRGSGSKLPTTAPAQQQQSQPVPVVANLRPLHARKESGGPPTSSPSPSNDINNNVQNGEAPSSPGGPGRRPLPRTPPTQQPPPQKPPPPAAKPPPLSSTPPTSKPPPNPPTTSTTPTKPPPTPTPSTTQPGPPKAGSGPIQRTWPPAPKSDPPPHPAPPASPPPEAQHPQHPQHAQPQDENDDPLGVPEFGPPPSLPPSSPRGEVPQEKQKENERENGSDAKPEREEKKGRALPPLKIPSSPPTEIDEFPLKSPTSPRPNYEPDPPPLSPTSSNPPPLSPTSSNPPTLTVPSGLAGTILTGPPILPAHLLTLFTRNKFLVLRAYSRVALKDKPSTIEVINFLDSTADESHLLFDFLKTVIDSEIASTDEPETLFRNNDYASKLLSGVLNDRGSAYLKSVLAEPIAQICATPPAVEIDPTKLLANENAEENLKNLTEHCKIILQRILASGAEMPEFFHIICNYLQTQAAKKFPECKQITNSLSPIAGLLFLRFFCVAIFAPAEVIEDKVPANAMRAMILISKVMQMIANGLVFGSNAEAFMVGMNPFLQEHSQSVIKFFTEAATLKEGVSIEPATNLEEKVKELLSKLEQTPDPKYEELASSLLAKIHKNKTQLIAELNKLNAQEEVSQLESILELYPLPTSPGPASPKAAPRVEHESASSRRPVTASASSGSALKSKLDGLKKNIFHKPSLSINKKRSAVLPSDEMKVQLGALLDKRKKLDEKIKKLQQQIEDALKQEKEDREKEVLSDGEDDHHQDDREREKEKKEKKRDLGASAPAASSSSSSSGNNASTGGATSPTTTSTPSPTAGGGSGGAPVVQLKSVEKVEIDPSGWKKMSDTSHEELESLKANMQAMAKAKSGGGMGGNPLSPRQSIFRPSSPPASEPPQQPQQPQSPQQETTPQQPPEEALNGEGEGESGGVAGESAARHMGMRKRSISGNDLRRTTMYASSADPEGYQHLKQQGQQPPQQQPLSPLKPASLKPLPALPSSAQAATKSRPTTQAGLPGGSKSARNIRPMSSYPAGPKRKPPAMPPLINRSLDGSGGVPTTASSPQSDMSRQGLTSSGSLLSPQAGDGLKSDKSIGFLETLLAAAKAPDSGLLKDRKWHFKMQKNCLVGSEFIDWMLQTYPELITNRGDGIRWAQDLMDNQCMVQIGDGNQFQDKKNVFYRFAEPNSESEDVHGIGNRMKKELKVSNRKDNEGNTVKKAFSGQEAVEWISKNSRYADPESAKNVCQQLLQDHFISLASKHQKKIAATTVAAPVFSEDVYYKFSKKKTTKGSILKKRDTKTATPGGGGAGGEDDEVPEVKAEISIPALVVEAITFIIDSGAVAQEGIFRVQGSKKDLNEFLSIIEKGKKVDWSTQPLSLITDYIKQYLQDLPEPVLTLALYDKFVSLKSIAGEVEEFIRVLKIVLDELPPKNREFLRLLLLMCSKIVEQQETSKMSSSLIAAVLGPHLLDSRQPLQSIEDMQTSNFIVESMVIFYDRLFA